MKYNKLSDVVKSGNIVIPLYIYKDFPKFNIDYETFIFLMYLYSKGNKIPFDINKLSEEFSCDIKKIMEFISKLQDNKLIEIKVIKNDKNIMEEFIYLDFFYDKISLDIVNEDDSKESKNEKDEIFEMLEKDVGLQLSFIEVEIVKAWNYDIDVIKEAIKEAIKNNVASIRYIDKVLYTWDKKGYKTLKDVENNRKSFREKDEEKDKKIEIYDEDWLEDDE